MRFARQVSLDYMFLIYVDQRLKEAMFQLHSLLKFGFGKRNVVSSVTSSRFESDGPERVLATLHKEENNIEGMYSDGESDFDRQLATEQGKN